MDNKLSHGSVFFGDGRKAIDPVNVPKGTLPERMTKSRARFLIQQFEEVGQSTHSGAGSTLWVIVTHCIERGLSYNLQVYLVNNATNAQKVHDFWMQPNGTPNIAVATGWRVAGWMVSIPKEEEDPAPDDRRVVHMKVDAISENRGTIFLSVDGVDFPIEIAGPYGAGNTDVSHLSSKFETLFNQLGLRVQRSVHVR